MTLTRQEILLRVLVQLESNEEMMQNMIKSQMFIRGHSVFTAMCASMMRPVMFRRSRIPRWFDGVKPRSWRPTVAGLVRSGAVR